MTDITRTTPFDEVLSLREAMNQLFSDSFVMPSALGRTEQTPLDLYETEDAYVAKLALPGLKAEDFEITLENNILRVHGETRSEKETEEARYHVRERRYGAFDRLVRFPSAVNGDQVDASLSEGILTIRVPRAEEAKAKRISVKAG